MFDKLKKAAGIAKGVAGKAKRAKRYYKANPAERKRMRLESKNDKYILLTCEACGVCHRMNSVYGGTNRICQCGAKFTCPTYADYIEANPPEPEVNDSPVEEPKTTSPPEYHDLESAILFFNEKKEKIDQLPINEDEKEMLLMKLQEKRERILDELI
jgi:hypothetical protein